jgi:hypothetical protein
MWSQIPAKAEMNPMLWYKDVFEAKAAILDPCLDLFAASTSESPAERHWSALDYVMSPRRQQTKPSKVAKVVHAYWQIRALRETKPPVVHLPGPDSDSADDEDDEAPAPPDTDELDTEQALGLAEEGFVGGHDPDLHHPVAQTFLDKVTTLSKQLKPIIPGDLTTLPSVDRVLPVLEELQKMPVSRTTIVLSKCAQHAVPHHHHTDSEVRVLAKQLSRCWKNIYNGDTALSSPQEILNKTK